MILWMSTQAFAIDCIHFEIFVKKWVPKNACLESVSWKMFATAYETNLHFDCFEAIVELRFGAFALLLWQWSHPLHERINADFLSAYCVQLHGQKNCQIKFRANGIGLHQTLTQNRRIWIGSIAKTPSARWWRVTAIFRWNFIVFLTRCWVQLLCQPAWKYERWQWVKVWEKNNRVHHFGQWPIVWTFG